ncbi:MFS transporter [Streptomyces sp. MMBL 11-3]|uniref:MFS transporter n=1 Tax=Streptomyces sp. MMBL 11-3 TaxID=3382639 RepID=UPI0039B637C9
MTGPAGHEDGTPPGEAGRFDQRLIAPLVLGSVLNPVNSSMLAVALIPIGRAFGAPPSQTAWLVSGLYLATAVGQPVIGRLVDLYGPRRLYLWGTALAGAAGLLGTLAPELWVLVVSRVLLGFGTSAAFPASMSLLRSEAGRTGGGSPAGTLAALSAGNQVIAVVGPALGGLLIGAGGWQLIFAVNVPLSLACLVLGALWLPRTVPSGTGTRVDVPGMLLFAGSLTSFMFFLMAPGVAHAYLVALGLAAGALFVRRELRTGEPFMDLRVLAGNAPLLLTYVRQCLAYCTAYAFFYGYGQWLQEARGLNASQAGLLLVPLSATAVAVTALTGRRGRIRGALVVGAAVQCAGCAVLLFLGDGSPLWLLVALSALVGVPHGLIGLANQNALYVQADPARMGTSAGLLRTSMYVGALFAAAANAAFFHDGATSAGLHSLARLLLGVAAVFLLVCVADRTLGRDGGVGGPAPRGSGPGPAVQEGGGQRRRSARRRAR